jgi:hypothetical protein
MAVSMKFTVFRGIFVDVTVLEEHPAFIFREGLDHTVPYPKTLLQTNINS